jgi:hypothetical protein
MKAIRLLAAAAVVAVLGFADVVRKNRSPNQHRQARDSSSRRPRRSNSTPTK